VSGSPVVVTGLGVVTAAGIGTEALWEAVVAPTDGPTHQLLGPVPPPAGASRHDLDRMDLFSQYALVAAEQALADAGDPELDPRRTGVVLGNVYGAMPSVVDNVLRHRDEGDSAVKGPYSIAAIENAPTSLLAVRYGLRGPTKVVVGACAGGAYAIADAVDLIRSGRCDRVLTGATQAPLTPHLEASYRALRVVSPSGRARPFDVRRDGLVFSDGAAVLVLESEALARQRGAKVWGRVLGAANTNDGVGMAGQTGEGAVECIQDALDDAGLVPSDIAHVNAHGTGTAMNDSIEAGALLEVFGRPGPPVTSTKGTTGHTCATAGAIEAVIALLSMAHGLVPPVGADHEADPEVLVDVVHGAARPWEPGPVLSNSFGLGGTNGCLVLGPP
jgi:3-oxoacyl-[acyl-carrier-protein] synthase II